MEDKTIFLCPVCDESAAGADLDPAADKVCTKEWLTGKELKGGEKEDWQSCDCFVTDPYAAYPEKGDNERRYFHYRTVALALGAEQGQCVDLPRCVRAKITELYGTSRTGFRSRAERGR